MTVTKPPASGPVDLSADRLGDLLLSEGIVTPAQLQAALAEQKTGTHRLGYILVKQGVVDELELTKMLARQYRMPAVDLSQFEVDPRLVPLIPPDLAAKRIVLPLRREGRTLTVAVADPTDQGLLEDLKFITRYDLFPVLAGEHTLKALIEKHYETGDEQLQTILREMEGIGEDVEVVEEEEDESIAAMQAAVDDAPVVKLINGVLTDAVKRGASDIHIEPFEHEIRIRYRVDGALLEVMKPPMKMKAALTSRIKILAQLNIAERRVPQDGRLKLKMGSRVIDFRVSTVPVLFGEKIVMRILDKGNL
ncbi:MAG: Flp pilus assembly complex ATPase component TadA, partial [Gemmatimonadetes bacterium]|nr:Flp pilus assembly complex ATPase component TadA [Gemmatimonadota bacterium]